MKIILCIMGIIVGTTTKTYAKDNRFYLLTPYKASMEYIKYRDKRDAYLPDYTAFNAGHSGQNSERWDYGAQLNLNLDLIRYDNLTLYWENTWHMGATNKQVRSVGWIWKLGIPLGNKFNIYYFHHSRHCLECNPNGAERKYPMENSFHLEMILLLSNNRP